jgi:hypothetical protein
MIKYENHCVGCERCQGSSCRNRRVPVCYCDKCGYEIEGDIYDVDGQDLCEDCLKEMFKKD